MKNPIQPLALDSDGVLRFKGNKIIGYLFETGKLDLNSVYTMDFPKEDKQQIAQLLGMSLSGYGDLRSFVDDDAYNAAETMYDEGFTDTQDAYIASLEHKLFKLRSLFREPCAELFGVNPEDLSE